MLRAVTASTRSHRFAALCVLGTLASAGCGNSAGSNTGEVATGGQTPGNTQSGGQTATNTGGMTSGAGTVANSGTAAVSGSTGTAGVSAPDSAGSGPVGTAGSAGESTSAGAGGAPAAPNSGPPTSPGVPPDVLAAWNEWPLPGKDYNNSRYTTNSSINTGNVSLLKEAWRVPLPGLVIAYGMVSTVPLIASGTVYLEDTYSSIRAIDLASGTVKWTVEGSDLNPGPNGVALGWGKVFAIRGSDSVAAYDAASGKELWVKNVVDTPTAGIDIQPTVFDNQVLISTVPISTRGIYTGGDRGILKALNQETGEETWRFDTIESPDDVWGNSNVNSGGGSWYPPSIDTDTGRIFWAVANPAPFPGTPEFPNGSSRPGANLYSDSTLVLDAKTGAYQWHHQTIQHDIFDRDLLHTMLTEVNGMPIVVSTGKEGRVWAYKRDSGEVLWGPTSVGMHKNDELLELTGATEVMPGSPPALADGVVYVAELNAPSMYSANATAYFGSSVGSMGGDVVAIDVATGEIKWDTLVDGDPTGGVAVVNDLVITATFQGNVIALQRDTGKEVWRWKAPGGINSWMSITGDTLIIPVGASDPAVVVALKLGDSGMPGTGTPTAGSGAAGSGGAGGSGAAGDPASFSAIYADILAPRCAGPVCHSGSATGGALNVAGANASAVRTSLLGKAAAASECMASGIPLVTAGQPDMSLLYRKVAAMPPCGSRMPPTGALSDADIGRIRTWIMNGALDN
jgi:outer membrane protein assembly factor BamB